MTDGSCSSKLRTAETPGVTLLSTYRHVIAQSSSWDAFPARSRTRVLDPSSSDQIVGVGHRIRGWQRLAMREEGAISRTRHAVKPRLDTRTLK
jgi:hypothetical protein